MVCKELIRIVIISLLFFLGTAEGAKLWSGASSPITAVQGQSVTMQWIVNLTSIDSSKTWTYAKVIQVQDGRTTDLMSLQKSGTKIINDARYQSRESDLNLNVSQSGATVTIKLTINNLVRSTDEKQYKAMLGFSSDSSTFPGATSLIISERPHSTAIAASPNQTSYCVNDMITITCVSRAHPSAKYSLYRNNQIVQSGGSSGVFAVSTAVTDRVFTCVPYNTVGTGQNRSFEVYVKEPPKILWCKINEAITTNRTFVEGSKVTMMCKLSGSEPIDVTWILINASPPLEWNQRNLTFNAISRKEEGWYRMNVNNGKECNTTESATFHVEVNYKPVDTSISVLPNQSTFCINDQIIITCETEAKPLPEFSLYQNNQLIQKGSKSGSLRLFLLVKGEMVLDCVSSNAMGSGQSKSLRVFVKEPPSISGCKVNNLDQTNITVKEGAKVTFSCEFSGTRPLNVTWIKESQTDIHWNQWNLTIHSVQRNDYGIYRVTVYNGKECNTAVSRTFSLVVNYINKLQVVGNNFNVFNKSTTSVNFEILIDAYPNVTLTCQSPQLKEELIFVQRNKKGSTKTQCIVTANTTNADSNIRLICKAENEVDSQTAGFLIYKQGDAKIVTGSMKLVGQDWRRDFSNVNSEAHKTLRGKCMKMLYDVYNDIPYVQKWDVLRFTPGSVVLYFHLHVIADVSDPFSPLRIAVAKNGGFVGNLEVDLTSIRKTDVADIERSNQSQTRNSTDIIIAFLGVIVAVSLVIHIILVVLLLRAKAASKSKRHVYDDPNLGSDNDHHHQGGIPLGERSSLPDSNPDDYDQPYHEIDNVQAISHSQTQVNIGRDNPTLKRSLPALPAEMDENQDQTQEISPTSTAAENDEAVGVQKGKPKRTCGIVEPASVGNKSEQQDEEANEPLKPPIPEVSAESSKGYNQLDRSTKLPPRDNRPTLQKQKSDENQMSSLIYTHKYQNRKENQSPSNSQDNKAVTLDERKPQKICEAQKSNVDSETELQKENSEDYNRLSHSMRETTKNSRPVSYEIPMLSEA